MDVLTPKRRISVVVPTCNRPAFLREALASIRAHEADSVTFEILVGDNGDLPETRQVAEAYDAIHIPVSVRGAAAARNAGLSTATGEFVAFLDDDDVWTADHVRAHLAAFDAHPEIEAVFAISYLLSRTINSSCLPRTPPASLISFTAKFAPLDAGKSSADSTPLRSKPPPILMVSSWAWTTIDIPDTSSTRTSNKAIDLVFIQKLLSLTVDSNVHDELLGR